MIEYEKLLDTMSYDIRKCEVFLQNFPITHGISYLCSGDTHLIWDLQAKRITFTYGQNTRSLIEFPVSIRRKGHEFLPKFIKYCVNEEAKLLDAQGILATHNEIASFISVNA